MKRLAKFYQQLSALFGLFSIELLAYIQRAAPVTAPDSNATNCIGDFVEATGAVDVCVDWFWHACARDSALNVGYES